MQNFGGTYSFLAYLLPINCMFTGLYPVSMQIALLNIYIVRSRSNYESCLAEGGYMKKFDFVPKTT